MFEYIRETEEKGTYEYWCPGCKRHHFVNRKIWNLDIPNNTISPSVLTKTINNSDEWETDKNGDFVFDKNMKAIGSKKITCHCFVRNGKIQFLNDCTHKLAGKTVDMEPLK